MIDGKNIGVLTGGLVADPETVNNGRIVKYRIATDFAGNERDSDNRTGYFHAVQFLDSCDQSNSKFVSGQMNNGNLKKGSQVQVVYRLQQSRWKTQEGKSASNVELVVESLNYAGSGSGSQRSNSSDSTTTGSDQAAEEATSIPSSF